jgi:hypothetical protein
MISIISRAFKILFVLSVLVAPASAQIYSWWNLPHMAIGGSYSSTLIIRDPQGISSRRVSVYLHKDNGTELIADVSGAGQQISSFDFTLTAAQEKSFVITSPGSPTSGWIQIRSDGIGELSASVRFAVADGVGNPTTVVGVLATEPNFEWEIAVDKRSSIDWTGIAVANPWNSFISINIDFFQNGVRVPGTTTRTFFLNGYGHLQKVVHDLEMFGSVWNNFSGVGTLRISSTNDSFVAMALRGDGLQYSSLPAEAEIQRWSWSYTESGSAQTGTWSWRFVDGYTFIGYEQNSFNGDKVRLRGSVASDYNDFIAEWNYHNSTDGTYGAIIFLGTPTPAGNVINGRRMQVKSDGTIVSSVPFTATRTY